MGYQNERRARFAGRNLRSIKAYKVLLEMAYASLDRDNPPVYFGGWRRLALMLGFDLSDLPEPGSSSAKVASNAVYAAQRTLIDAGLIQRINDPRARGRTASFEVLVDVFQQLDPNAESGSPIHQKLMDADPPVSDAGSIRNSWDQSTRNSWPKEGEGSRGSNLEDLTHPSRVTTGCASVEPITIGCEVSVGDGQPHTYVPDENDLYCVCGRHAGHSLHEAAIA